MGEVLDGSRFEIVMDQAATKEGVDGKENHV